MAFARVLGRCLLVAAFLMNGIAYFIETERHIEVLPATYSRLYANAAELSGYHLIVNPAIVMIYSRQLVYALGALQIVGALLAILNQRVGTVLLLVAVAVLDGVLHNPVAYMHIPELQIQHTRILILDLGTLAGLFLLMSNK